MQTPGSRPPNDRKPVEIEPFEVKSPDLDGEESSMDPEHMTLENWVEAESMSRPTLPDENADGLDDLEAEIQRQAEDVPSDRSGRD